MIISLTFQWAKAERNIIARRRSRSSAGHSLFSLCVWEVAGGPSDIEAGPVVHRVNICGALHFGRALSVGEASVEILQIFFQFAHGLVVLSADFQVFAHLFQPGARDGVMLRRAGQNIFCALDRLIDDLINFIHKVALHCLSDDPIAQVWRRVGKALRAPF